MSRAFFIIGLLLLPGSVKAQDLSFGIVMPEIREALRKEWRNDVWQVERAYCVTQATLEVRSARNADNESVGTDRIVRVFAVEPAQVRGASSIAIQAVHCPQAAGVIHTHPPITCTSTGCKVGGIDAYECMASRKDYESLVALKLEWGIVQCGPEEFVFYWAKDFK